MRERETFTCSRYGGGTFRRGGRRYRSQICTECAVRLFEAATPGHDTNNRWSVCRLGEISLIARGRRERGVAPLSPFAPMTSPPPNPPRRTRAR